MGRRKARQTQARWRRAQYAARRDAGRCVDCNTRLDVDTARCQRCRDDNTTRSMAAQQRVWDRVYGLTETGHVDS